MTVPFLEQHGAHLLIHIKAVPNSSRTQLAGTLGNALKIKIAQPPEDGKANKAIIQLLAELLQIPQNQVTLISSPSRPQKTFQLTGITLESAQKIFSSRLANNG